ncbi:hypothetical protein CHUAL_000603 [Chamberlinius hualienensis]
MSDDHVVLSDEEDADDDGGQDIPDFSGSLQKWTNYIHGWQDRYVVLKDGTLSYYKSETETSFGCRGSISIHKSSVRSHEFDEFRFDVSVNDCVWYLRAESREERQKWVDALDACKAESGYGSENSLRRHGSAISIASATLSSTSTSSFKKGRGLREKLAEMETFKDILCRQVDTLQSYFDACAESVAAMDRQIIEPHDHDDDIDGLNNVNSLSHNSLLLETKQIQNAIKAGILSKELLLQHGAHAMDFKGEAITFKATTSGILTTLSHCIELITQREDSWRRRLEKEVERRKKMEDLYRQASAESQKKSSLILGGPDYEEGPHSAIPDEEFYDAVETSLDRFDSEDERVKFRTLATRPRLERPQSISLTQHSLWPEINRITTEQLNYAKMGVGEGGWFIFAEDGEMRMYKREVEESGVVVDPLKAVHTVKGFTGREMCHYFFDPSVRMEWETTVETMKVVETVSEDCLVFHQVHKRVWPAAQRDALFWSHIRSVPVTQDEEAHDIWIVCNHSTDYLDIPVGKCLRVKLTICLVCQTFVEPSDSKEIQRDNLTCKITYCAVVNPGGWAPSSVLRAVYKREYPKFLKRFTQYVKEQTENKEILW